MNHVYHILNGDALLSQFPATIKGDKLVCRECFVEGPVSKSSLTSFLNERKNYLTKNYGKEVKLDYEKDVATQFHQISSLPNLAEINLWFEEDLFCQVNLWFILFLLHEKEHRGSIFLVRPLQHTPFAFGKLTVLELAQCYNQRKSIKDLTPWASLWKAYQKSDFNHLRMEASGLQNTFPFVSNAVTYHVERFPKKGNLGRPKEQLKQIIKKLNTKEFGPVFQVFSEKEAHYGFGDLLVKKLHKELLEEISKKEDC